MFFWIMSLGDTLSLAKTEGYVNVRRWDSWAPSVFGERESIEFDFSGSLKQSEDNRWVELLVPGLTYENSMGDVEYRFLEILHDYTGRV